MGVEYPFWATFFLTKSGTAGLRIYASPLHVGIWWGGVSGKELCLFGDLVGRKGLDCDLVPTCKEPFQYFIHYLGCASAVSSDRPRLCRTEEKRCGDRNKDQLISQAEPSQGC